MVSQKVQGELKKLEGVAASEIDFETGKSQIIAEVDDLESKRLGLSTFVVARELREHFLKMSSVKFASLMRILKLNSHLMMKDFPQHKLSKNFL